MGGMQFQRLLEGGAGLLFLTQAKLPQADEVMRVGLPHTLAGLFAELGEVVRAFAFRKLFFAGLDQALKMGLASSVRPRFCMARAPK